MYTSNVENIKAAFTQSLPTTYDFLKPNVFRFKIQSLPQVSYTCQAANLPGLSAGVAKQPTPFHDLNRIGDKMEFDDLSLTFIVSEDAANFKELYNWLVAIGFPENYNQTQNYVQQRASLFNSTNLSTGGNEYGICSDATLTIMDSANNPKINVVFKDLFPVSLSGLDFDLRSSTVEYLSAVATFKYKFYEIEVL